MTASWVLPLALDDTDTTPSLRPMPQAAAEILHQVAAPPRLVAHLRAVHDVAALLVEWIFSLEHTVDGVDLGLALDTEGILFGAATHDIGKTLHPGELTGPGSAHEAAGRDLLLAHGVAPHLARFAATHATWSAGSDLEELLVSLADAVWKGKRVQELEDLVVARLVAVTGRAAWEQFLALDDVLTRIGDGADARLAFQMSCPVSATSTA